LQESFELRESDGQDARPREKPEILTKIWGTSPDSIDTEDRERFEKILHSTGIAQPPNGIARSYEDALVVSRRIGYPVVVRPSYVFRGRDEIVYSDAELSAMTYAVQVAGASDFD